jgi:hypothetical protein
MKLVTRAQLGWPPSAAPTQTTTLGVKVHYEGSPVSRTLLTDHAACIAEWKAIRASHLANVAENYSDVAYNYAACPHGYLLEGRGLRRRTGANGNQTLNIAHYAIVGLVGSSGLTEPTDGMLNAIRDGIDLLRQNGAGPEVKGHRDGYATACPGAPLYAWVQKGAPRPTTSPPPQEEDMTPEQDALLKKLASQTNTIYGERRYYSWGYENTNVDARDTYGILTDMDKRLKALESVELTPEQLQALAAQVSTSPTLAETIAELVADKLAARLAE